MKVICDRGALVEMLNLVSGVIVTRTPKPVLTCVKLEAEGSTLTLSATDMEIALRVSSSKVDVQEPGEALIPADKFNQIVRESVDPTITFTREEDTAHIRGQDSHFKVFGYRPADFPPIPHFSGEADFEVSAADLHKLISQTIFATARENTRYAINGVLLEREGNKLNVVATDGRRLALAKGLCKPGKADGEARRHHAIVPTKALSMLLKLFDDPEQVVKVRVADNQIMFASDDAFLSSNLVEGAFPPYRDVIPRDGDKRATLATDTFASAIRRAAVLTNEESKGVRLSFAKEGLTLSSRAPEMGEAEVNADLPRYEGEAIDIGFNPFFVLDALKVVQSGEVTLEMKAPNKPGVLLTGDDFLYVIMPVNLQ
jgi:DNA polymerase III subunit beta